MGIEAAYQSGWNAHNTGAHASDNPFTLKDDPNRFIAWRRGFQSAQQIMEIEEQERAGHFKELTDGR